MNDLLARLAEPFAPSEITWKPGTSKGDKCLALAYADLRAYQRRLDEVCGLDWSVQYEPWGEDRIIAKLTIAGATRSSTGEHNAQDEKNNMAGTVAEAQAMKRACAMFGLGRFLYELPSVWVDFDATAKRISKSGQAELDKRYRDWYARYTAQKAPPRGYPQVDATTGEMASGPLRANTEPDDNEDADLWETKPPKKPNLLSQAQLTRLNMLGMDLYKTKEKWDKERKRLVEFVSKGAISSSKELSPDEATVLITGLEKEIAKTAVANAKVAA